MDDLVKLEHEFEEKIKDVAKWVSKEIGEPIEDIGKEIKIAFEKIEPHLSQKTKLELKKEFTRIGTPAIGVFLAFSWTGGQPNPAVLPILALGGGFVGWWESREIEKKIKEIEERERAKLKKEVI